MKQFLVFFINRRQEAIYETLMIISKKTGLQRNRMPDFEKSMIMHGLYNA